MKNEILLQEIRLRRNLEGIIQNLAILAGKFFETEKAVRDLQEDMRAIKAKLGILTEGSEFINAEKSS